VGHADDTNGLHAVQVVNDGQTVEAERAVGKVVDVLEAKAVRTTVSDLKAALHLLVNVHVRAKYTPNTAHFLS
jgi:hypothetical protein